MNDILDITVWQAVALALTVPVWICFLAVWQEITEFRLHWTISILGCLLMAAAVVLL